MEEELDNNLTSSSEQGSTLSLDGMFKDYWIDYALSLIHI